MDFFIGLGNPGEKYQNNRHNVGQMFLDFLIKRLKGWGVEKLKEEEYYQITIIQSPTNQSLAFIKPKTFMNQSGLVVKELFYHFKTIKPSSLFIIHDDLDIPLGKFKIQKAEGPKLHNGLESIEKSLGTKDFWRIRIGVDNRSPENRLPGETYVLQDFFPQEKKLFENQIFPKIFHQLQIRKFI